MSKFIFAFHIDCCFCFDSVDETTGLLYAFGQLGMTNRVWIWCIDPANGATLWLYNFKTTSEFAEQAAQINLYKTLQQYQTGNKQQQYDYQQFSIGVCGSTLSTGFGNAAPYSMTGYQARPYMAKLIEVCDYCTTLKTLCKNNATCINSPQNDFTCVCSSPQWGGKYCNETVAAATPIPNAVSTPNWCIDNECDKSSNCTVNAKSPIGYTCKCPLHKQGQYCNLTNICTAYQPCKHGSTCTQSFKYNPAHYPIEPADQESLYKCTCDRFQNYRGVNCTEEYDPEDCSGYPYGIYTAYPCRMTEPVPNGEICDCCCATKPNQFSSSGSRCICIPG
jgi:hypothetical protein